MPERELTCRELVEFLMAYDDGELAPAERAVFEAHLAECPDCVAYLEGYRRTVALGKRAFADEKASASAAVPEELVAAVLAARRRQRR
jgi:anti-sigma factor RsiW